LIGLLQRHTDADLLRNIHLHLLLGYPIRTVLQIIQRHLGVARRGSVLDHTRHICLRIGPTLLHRHIRDGV